MENQKMPEYETIRAAVAGEKWAVEKVVECYKDEIDRLSTVAVRQPDGSTKQEINEDMRQSITKKLIEALPQFPLEEMAAESGQAADALKDAEKRLADMAVLIKNVSTYQKTKPVYDAYRKARNREKYRAGQEQAIILHEAAARSLKAAGIAKLPNLAALQSEYEALQAQKEALYADYGKLKKKVREYDIIKQNIDSILQADRQPEREKGTERG